MTSASSDRPPDGMRADAARNRARILDSARRLFAECGLDVPMTDIAEDAGVGVGTLYRRFASREELITAIFAAKIAGYAEAAEAALTDPDPWQGLSGLLSRLCQWQAEDWGFNEVLLTSHPQAAALEADRRRIHRAVTRLVRRAKADGLVRDDVTAEDVALLLLANAGVVNATRDLAPTAWRRSAGLMISALRAGNTASVPAPPGARAISRVLSRPGPAADRP